MIRFVSENMQDGEIAAMYQDGADAIVMLNDSVTDSKKRAAAVNNLLSRSSPALTL